MEYQIIWFILWGTLWAVYFMLDGFDLGAGILHNFIARNEADKKTILRTFTPFWNGNEVWLITAGGATFAAFPGTYALMFSYLYSALLLILFALILRGVAVEFRGKLENKKWKKYWDIGIFVGSLLPALLFGVAFGNIFQGLPMDSQGYHGSLIGLLNPYGLLTGILFVVMFLVHGAIWIAIKTNGDLSDRASVLSGKLWYLFLVLAVIFLIHTAFATDLYSNFLEAPILIVMPLLAVISLLGVKFLLLRQKHLSAFYSSCLVILTIIFTGVIGLYPNLIPSSIDKNFSLTIFNSSSSAYTLKLMTIVALIFVPIIIIYQILMYRLFRQKLIPDQVIKEDEY
jgi:cytochrome bd ubiquinol oxidase subunit II